MKKANFKQRHGILFKSNQGEGGAINMESLQEWQQAVLQAELGTWAPDDIYNVDETVFFGISFFL